MEELRNIFFGPKNKKQKQNNKAVNNSTEQSEESCSNANPDVLEWVPETVQNDPLFINMKWILTNDSYKCDRVVSYLLSKLENKQFVGLDIEFDPCFVKGQTSKTALIQIGVHTGHCLLLQVLRMKNLPPLLVKLLIDASILKLGVGIQEDIIKIKKDFNVEVKGAIDLRSIAPPAQKCGLAALVKDHLNTVLPKSKKLVMSKWSKELSPAKQAYAAKDAYVAELLALKLVAKELTISEDKVERNDIITVQKRWKERLQVQASDTGKEKKNNKRGASRKKFYMSRWRHNHNKQATTS